MEVLVIRKGMILGFILCEINMLLYLGRVVIFLRVDRVGYKWKVLGFRRFLFFYFFFRGCVILGK